MLGTDNFMTQIYSAERTQDILCWKKQGKNEMYLLCLIFFSLFASKAKMCCKNKLVSFALVNFAGKNRSASFFAA